MTPVPNNSLVLSIPFHSAPSWGMDTALPSSFPRVLCLSVVSVSSAVWRPGSPTCSTDTSEPTRTAGLPTGPVTWAPFSDRAQAWFSCGTSEQRARLGVLFSEQISPGMGTGYAAQRQTGGSLMPSVSSGRVCVPTAVCPGAR